jgi:hypothetical protein
MLCLDGDSGGGGRNGRVIHCESLVADWNDSSTLAVFKFKMIYVNISMLPKFRHNGKVETRHMANEPPLRQSRSWGISPGAMQIPRRFFPYPREFSTDPGRPFRRQDRGSACPTRLCYTKYCIFRMSNVNVNDE